MCYEDIVDFWQKKNISNSDELAYTLDSYSVNFTYNSGKIENNEITYHDIREIFDKNGVTSYTGSLKTLFEIQNSKIAYEKLLDAFDKKEIIDEDFVKKIHKYLTKGTYDERRYRLGERPGEYKHHDYVTGKYEVGASPSLVHEEMLELLDDINDLDTVNKDILKSAAYFHAKLENIHPFSDGNGRVGRLMMNYFLIIHNYPPIIIFEEDKKKYYSALEEYDKNIDLKPLITFLKEQSIKTWKNYIDRDK